jgi:glycosyltransferase involved in cell wall biosynthesis
MNRSSSPVSIVIPVLNEETSISTLLTKIEAQSLLPSEVIFVDAGSTDGTLEILNGWDTKLFTIKVIDASPSYPGKGRNVGVKAAQNNIIAFLDCGLFPTENWLAESYKLLVQNKAIDGVWGRCLYEGKSPLSTLICAYSFGQKSYFPYFLASSLFKRSIFEKGFWFREDLRASEDSIWRNQVLKNFNTKLNTNTQVTYTHFPEKLSLYLKKWKTYGEHTSFAEHNLTQQVVYFGFFLALFSSLAFSSSAWLIMMLAYFIVRGVLDPVRRSKGAPWFSPYYWLVFVGPFFILLSDFFKMLGFAKGNLKRIK